MPFSLWFCYFRWKIMKIIDFESLNTASYLSMVSKRFVHVESFSLRFSKHKFSNISILANIYYFSFFLNRISQIPPTIENSLLLEIILTGWTLVLFFAFDRIEKRKWNGEKNISKWQVSVAKLVPSTLYSF